MEWLPIEEADIAPFDSKKWFHDASPRLLLTDGNFIRIGYYSYTRTGKGRWRSYLGICTPTHFMPLPTPPEAE